GLPIIGGGGIYDTGDVLEFLIAGASAVSVGTAMFRNPGVALEIIEGLPGALGRVGARSVGELTGTLELPA
ncbi:MAG: dihydroorotate dehydrogenase, partial [Actinobacteria bacterium]|nr:dihydroorotate dehydrogenase [Actinomycetota bacterium]